MSALQKHNRCQLTKTQWKFSLQKRKIWSAIQKYIRQPTLQKLQQANFNKNTIGQLYKNTTGVQIYKNTTDSKLYKKYNRWPALQKHNT